MNDINVEIQKMPYQVDGGVGFNCAVGLISLAFDQTIEHEFNRLMSAPGLATYCTRIKSIPKITNDVLKQMEEEIEICTAMLPPGVSFDVIAFGCTSAALVIGEDVVANNIRKVLPGVNVTDPGTAAIAALNHLNVKRIGVLTPYVPEVNVLVRSRLEKAGFEIAAMASFCESDDNIVAKISESSVESALLSLGKMAPMDAIFMSCTSLRALNVLEEIEQRLGIPITTSTHALAWHSLALGGVTSDRGVGQLFG